MKHKGTVSIILTVISVFGFGATCYAVAKHTPDALERIKTAEDNKKDDLTMVEKVKAAAPAYASSAVLGVSTIACIVGSTILDKREQASLSSAIAFGSNYIHKYKGKIKELFGEELDKKVEESVDIEKPEDYNFTYDDQYDFASYQNASEDNPGTPMLFYDLSSGTFFEKTLEQVLLAEYFLNRDYILAGEVTLNDWYNYIGLKDHMDELYNNLVWTPLEEGDEWIDFSHRHRVTDDGREYYEIEIITEPHHLDETPLP